MLALAPPPSLARPCLALFALLAPLALGCAGSASFGDSDASDRMIPDVSVGKVVPKPGTAALMIVNDEDQDPKEDVKARPGELVRWNGHTDYALVFLFREKQFCPAADPICMGNGIRYRVLYPGETLTLRLWQEDVALPLEYRVVAAPNLLASQAADVQGAELQRIRPRIIHRD